MLTALLAPWRRARTWTTLAHLVLDLPVAGVAFALTIAFLATAAGLLITFPLALPFAWWLFVQTRGLARLERSRFAALLGVELADPVPTLQAQGWYRRVLERARCGPRWREIGYFLLALPVSAITFSLAVVAWCGSLALLLLPLYAGSLPDGTAKLGFAEVAPGTGALAAAAAGLAGVVVLAPWLTVGLGAFQATIGRWLLGRPQDAELIERVAEAETGRVAAVDAAEAERRRIERDLHDGAQQRLVALAMDLGAAREKLESDPEAGKALVAEAHDEAKAALQELRDLVRGIHPVILEDRGLDAALSAVVARVPVPVDLRVETHDRLPPPVESAAYFIVAEALTNVTKHARATRAWVGIARAGDRLFVEVRDDGRGGAVLDTGTGLRGIHDRAVGLGGTMHVLSPEGGPTTVLVELPCAS